MAVTYVKRSGAPAGVIRISSGSRSFLIDDGSNSSITTSDAATAQLLDTVTFLQREGSTDDPYIPPVSTAPVEFIQDTTPLIGDVLTRTSRGYEFMPSNWRGPVATGTELLTLTGNQTGDVRLVLADFSLHVWTGTEWISVASGGGSGPGTDFIDIDANLAGIQNGDSLLYSGSLSLFRPGVIT